MAESEPQNRRLGYALVSTYGRTLDTQLEQLRAAGCNSRNIYREKVTAARPAMCRPNGGVLLTAPRLAHAGVIGLVAADESATFSRAVSGLSAVIVGPGRWIEPDDHIVRAMLLCLTLGREIHQRRLWGSSGRESEQHHTCNQPPCNQPPCNRATRGPYDAHPIAALIGAQEASWGTRITARRRVKQLLRATRPRVHCVPAARTPWCPPPDPRWRPHDG